MTSRQRALLGYLNAIRPELEGARNPEELLSRIMKCVAEDSGWAAQGIAAVVKGWAMRYVESRADEGLGRFSQFVEELIRKRAR